jgi:SAM-dependent methyltransferase
LSSRKRVPLLKLQQRTYYPQQFFRLMLLTRNWSVLSRTPDYVMVQIDNSSLKLIPSYLSIVFSEWHLEWERYYLPPFDLKGKTVLDVGAGCGETALFYFKHGARKVICVEANPQSLSFLRENSLKGDWNTEIIEGLFSLDMLNLDFDFMKMDCEGCESLLRGSDHLSPCVIEVHEAETARALTTRFGLRTLGRSGPNWLLGLEAEAQASF